MNRSLPNSTSRTPRRFLLLPEESHDTPGRGLRIRRYRLASVAQRTGPAGSSELRGSWESSAGKDAE
ncbi:MAG TPA: hypothetical protein VNY52_01340 [Solirubrobacteraceae bacterium]|nr:hypothetical protein [Solirubrobacteraceae bacterium]